MMKATIQFETGQGRTGLWTMTKEFSDMKHLDNFIKYIHRTKGYLLDEVWYEGYPFSEGDTYYTIEETPDRYVVVESCWDEVSEELFDQNRNRFLTWSLKEANEYAEKLNNGTITIIRHTDED